MMWKMLALYFGRVYVGGDMETAQEYLEETSEIQWSKLTPEKARVQIRAAMAQARETVQRICDVQQPSFANTFAALDESDAAMNRGWMRLTHLQSVMDNPALREVIAELTPEVVEFGMSVLLNEKLYAVLKRAAAQDWVHQLGPVQQRLISETLTSFRENGAELSADDKKKVSDITTELARLSREFGEHVLDSTNAWEYITTDPAEVAGLPDSALQAAAQDALARGHGTEQSPAWRFTLQFPSVQPVLTYAENEGLRRRVWEGMQTRGTGEYDTEALIHRILRLREQKAHLLGYATFADYATSRRMVGSGSAALAFIDHLHDEVKPVYEREMEAIRRFAEQQTGHDIPVLNPWDVSYRKEKRRRALFDFDAEQVRPYFPMPHLLRGMFSIYEGLYGIRITERPTWCPQDEQTSSPGRVEVWHPDVLCFEIQDAGSDELLCVFYADWFPRETKRAGAWMECLSCGRPPVDGQPRVPHVALMCGNLSRPIGGQPALLNHCEVETIFHEFGHLLHQALSDVPVRSLAGCNVAWDFVELPSQINENWTWEKEALDRISSHVTTGEPLPADLAQKLLTTRNYGAASAFMRQLSFAKLDLELHVHTQRYLDRPLEEIDREILTDYRVPLSCMGKTMLRAFTHIFDGGYEAGYYSYKWAEMLEADAFSRFAREGIFNPETGRDFRRCILSQGNSRPAAQLYHDFMHRDPDPEALLRRAFQNCGIET